MSDTTDTAKATPSVEPDPYATASSPNGSSQCASSWRAFVGEPKQIGRYRVTGILGEGNFGRVYAAFDDELHRAVAIKMPLAKRLSRSKDVEAYLAEARVLASLSHPNIVAVYDAGRVENGACFVVSKFIEGFDLAQQIKKAWPSVDDATRLVAVIADALHYAHLHGLVHRDVKPANILIDATGVPFLADFGLALKDADFGKGSGFAGSPAYMSPEQARGEGHRVDGRSDIFSLGVIFYELLTHRRPFAADSLNELLELIANVEAKPPRQINDTIPAELERICLKALSKRATDRYSTAKDLSDDLRHFFSNILVHRGAPDFGVALLASLPPKSVADAANFYRGRPLEKTAAPENSPSSGHRQIEIVPKGLRSFDAQDADFFLQLLPGPRDRDGLPDTIRFWKTRIEKMDAADTFTVGLIYGPSGCGKSSLMKAGLLPRLSDAIIPVYIEATGAETEARLLSGLRNRCMGLAPGLSLKPTLSALRRGEGIPSGKKVVIVLDQFEQWLHAKKEETSTELVQSLRQCDGEHVQAIIMVRDDFWLAVSRFLRELEVRLVEGHNSALVDLFDADHARKILASFGRAFGKLPENPSDITSDQKQFLSDAVAGLAQEGKVVSVRLSLFADMMKSRPWTPASLKQVGGAEGIGVTFLEETFSAATAPPEHRYHQKAARAVLKSLLPESGTEIKGHMRFHAELLEASGYASRAHDFDELLRILDREIRLLTPTDPEGKSDEPSSQIQAGAKYYQLTHDYLVPSLRDWLTRKQRETRRGRTELLLSERAAVWNARPENRQLPSLWQWISIRSLTQKKNRTPPQRMMMWAAARYHIVRSTLITLSLALIGFTSWEGFCRLKAQTLRDRLVDASTPDVPNIIKEMQPYRRWLDSLLAEQYAHSEHDHDRRKQLHASLALLPVDANQVEYLHGRLLDAEPHEVPVIRDTLLPHKDQLNEKLWMVMEKHEKGKESQRLRAASALATFDPRNDKWGRANVAAVEDLVVQNPVFLGQWSNIFRPVKDHLIPPLIALFQDRRPEKFAERALASNLLADYAASDPKILAELVMNGDEQQFAILYPKLKDHPETGASILIDEIGRILPPDAADNLKETLAKRQANAAIALLKMDRQQSVWPLLKHIPDPRLRSYLIRRFGPLNANASVLINRFDEESDVTIQRALILSVGEFGDEQLSEEDRVSVITKLEHIYKSAPDAGLHAAAEWLLRSWKHDVWLKKTNESLAKSESLMNSHIEEIKRRWEKEPKTPQWYVNGQIHTMIVIPGPVVFDMGTPATAVYRQADERYHKKQIDRSFAVASKAVTMEQYNAFFKQKEKKDYFCGDRNYHRMADLPAVGIDWYSAAEYCNWLTEQEGLGDDQKCYQRDETGKVTGLSANYLSLVGYRLPSEAEIECATRAGAVTSRYFGETEELLPKYAWFLKNSGVKTWPVGKLKPNDWGFFDLHGNSYNWCQDEHLNYATGGKGEVIKDIEGNLIVDATKHRVLRGGSFYAQAANVRSANRDYGLPTNPIVNYGFRPARTFRN